MGRFEVEVRIKRVVFGKLGGRIPVMHASKSAVVEDAGKGRHRVGGSDRPGKVSRRTLTTGPMANDEGEKKG